MPGEAKIGQQVFEQRQKQRPQAQQSRMPLASDCADSNKIAEPQTACFRECSAGAPHFKKEIRRKYPRVRMLHGAHEVFNK